MAEHREQGLKGEIGFRAPLPPHLSGMEVAGHLLLLLSLSAMAVGGAVPKEKLPPDKNIQYINLLQKVKESLDMFTKLGDKKSLEAIEQNTKNLENSTTRLH